VSNDTQMGESTDLRKLGGEQRFLLYFIFLWAHCQ